MIQRCVNFIEALSGQRPQGWHTKTYPSVNTRRLLVEEGFSYDSNAYNDDLPYFADVAGLQKLLAHIESRGQAWVAARATIASHWRFAAG